MKRVRKLKSANFTVLANDPSLTGWGYAIIEPPNNIIEVGCIKTGAENKKRRIRKGDDTIRRVSEINHELLKVIRHHKINYILSELPHGSQNASAATMVGIVSGIAQTIADTLNLPIDWYSEGDAKKHLLNKRSATKQETIDAIKSLYHVPWFGIKYKDEAVADALAIYHVALSESSLLKMKW